MYCGSDKIIANKFSKIKYCIAQNTAELLFIDRFEYNFYYTNIYTYNCSN